LPWAAASRANRNGSYFALPLFLPPIADRSIVPDIPPCDIERRVDGAVVVRVHSRATGGRALPDAVFAFRAGDPQYTFWEQQLRQRELLLPTELPSSELPLSLPMYEPT
jgi:hypothetical protein